MRTLRARFLALALLAAGALCASCNTPTLPIPPPIIEGLTKTPPDTNGLVMITLPRGACSDHAVYLMVLDVTNQSGAFAARQGDFSFLITFPALSGDYLQLFCMNSLWEIGQGTTELIVVP